MFGELIGGITNLVVGWVNNKQEMQREKQKTELEVEKNKQRLAADQAEYNAEWEMAALQDKDKALRRLSFAMFSAPLVIAIFSPHHVQEYFSISLNSVPEWWVKSFVAINGAIWGITSLKNAVPQMILNTKRALKKESNQ